MTSLTPECDLGHTPNGRIFAVQGACGFSWLRTLGSAWIGDELETTQC